MTVELQDSYNLDYPDHGTHMEECEVIPLEICDDCRSDFFRKLPSVSREVCCLTLSHISKLYLMFA